MGLYPDWMDETNNIMIQDDDDLVIEGYSYEYNIDRQTTFITHTGKSVRDSFHKSYLWWVFKCLHTERYHSPYYSTDFGVEFEEILNKDYARPVTESEMARSITEALMVDSRTIDVINFTFEWESDALYIDFELENVYNTDTISIRREG